MTHDGGAAWMLECVLIALDGSVTRITTPSLSAAPPARIRVPSNLAGAAVVDVYTFSGVRGSPPEAVYTYSATLPRTTEEPGVSGPGASEPPELGPPRDGEQTPD